MLLEPIEKQARPSPTAIHHPGFPHDVVGFLFEHLRCPLSVHHNLIQLMRKILSLWPMRCLA